MNRKSERQHDNTGAFLHARQAVKIGRSTPSNGVLKRARYLAVLRACERGGRTVRPAEFQAQVLRALGACQIGCELLNR